MRRNPSISSLASLLTLVLGCALVLGCEMVRSKVCVAADAKTESKAELSDSDTSESPAPGLPKFLYARARYFPNPTVRQDKVPVLHMCWYLAESSLTFETPSEFEIAMQTNPASAKVTSLYEFFSPASELAAKMQVLNESGSGELDKSGIPQLALVMGDLDRLSLGLGNLIHSAPAALVALSYFGGNFAQLKNDSANLTKRAIVSQLSAASTTHSPPPGSPKKAIQAAKGQFQSLSPLAVDILEKNLKSWGTNAPPEAILRLPIEILVDFACPAY